MLLPVENDKIRDLYFDYFLHQYGSTIKNTKDSATALLASLPFLTDANQKPIPFTLEQQTVVDAILQRAIGVTVAPGAAAVLSPKQRLECMNNFILQEFRKEIPNGVANAKTSKEKNFFTELQTKLKYVELNQSSSAQAVEIISQMLQRDGDVLSEDHPLRHALALRGQWLAVDLDKENQFAKWIEDNKASLNTAKFLSVMNLCLGENEPFLAHEKFDTTLLNLTNTPNELAPLKNDERQILLKLLALNFLKPEVKQEVVDRENLKLIAEKIDQQYNAAIESLESDVSKKILAPLQNVIKALGTPEPVVVAAPDNPEQEKNQVAKP